MNRAILLSCLVVAVVANAVVYTMLLKPPPPLTYYKPSEMQSPKKTAITYTAQNKRYVFKIKTKDGGIIGNIVFHARSKEAAEAKLMQRYPGCTVLDCQEKN